jgi:hypothetical protein
MIVTSPQILATEMHRRELVLQGIHEQWVAQMLEPAARSRLTVPALAPSSLLLTVRPAVGAVRALLSNLASVALRFAPN